MKIIGHGIDLVDSKRLATARYFTRLTEYFLTPAEIADMHASRDAVQFAASRWAAKEAVIKASPLPLTYYDIVISKEVDKPLAKVKKTPQYIFFLSISHTFAQALASAIAVEI